MFANDVVSMGCTVPWLTRLSDFDKEVVSLWFIIMYFLTYFSSSITVMIYRQRPLKLTWLEWLNHVEVFVHGKFALIDQIKDNVTNALIKKYKSLQKRVMVLLRASEFQEMNLSVCQSTVAGQLSMYKYRYKSGALQI